MRFAHQNSLETAHKQAYGEGRCLSGDRYKTTTQAPRHRTAHIILNGTVCVPLIFTLPKTTSWLHYNSWYWLGTYHTLRAVVSPYITSRRRYEASTLSHLYMRTLKSHRNYIICWRTQTNEMAELGFEPGKSSSGIYALDSLPQDYGNQQALEKGAFLFSFSKIKWIQSFKLQCFQVYGASPFPPAHFFLTRKGPCYPLVF